MQPARRLCYRRIVRTCTLALLLATPCAALPQPANAPRFASPANADNAINTNNAINADNADSAVLAEAGNLPLILTIPHDGGQALCCTPARTTGTRVRDTGTYAFARQLAARLEARTGQRPYMVVARYSRQYLDVNRPEAQALQSPQALPAYRAYHAQIARFVAETKSRFPAGALLLDIHGQGAQPDTVFIGTQTGLSTHALLQRQGSAAMQGSQSLIGQLAAKGYPTSPAAHSTNAGATLATWPRYAGGYTITSYGSHHAGGIDAMQIELGKNLRRNLPPAKNFAHDFADALLVFMQAYGLLQRP